MSATDRVPPMPAHPDLRAIAIGLVGGLASGMLGVGGGVVLVPALVFALHMRQQDANVVSLAAIVPIATVGAASFVGAGHIDAPIGAALVAGSMLGAVIGVRLLAHAPEAILRYLFAIVVTAAGIRMLLP